jgi:hypothetical protein
MPGIKRASFIGISLVFYEYFYNLNKIRGLNYLVISRVYKRWFFLTLF